MFYLTTPSKSSGAKHLRIRKHASIIGTALAITVSLAGCANTQNNSADSAAIQPGESPDYPGQTVNPDEIVVPAPEGNVVLVTTNSFAISDETKAAFEAESGLTLTVLPVGSAGILANQLVLTRDHPLGDAFFGVDNTFISRLIDNDVVVPGFRGPHLDFLEGYISDSAGLTPITQGDVCLNVDTQWFAAQNIAPPNSLADLVDPTYRGMTVVLNPATSSPGMAFLLTTIAAFGDPSRGLDITAAPNTWNNYLSRPNLDPQGISSWQDFWTRLRANDVWVSDSWSDGYFSDFSGAGEGGQRPIVVSYASSPASTLNSDGTATTTAALLNTCFRQVEFAGVLQNANNVPGAEALIEFLISTTFQQDLPTQMWVYPIRPDVELPADWAQFAPQAQIGESFGVGPAAIEQNREGWLEEWTQIAFG